MKLSFYRKFRRFPKWTKLSKRPQSVWVWYRGRWLKHLPQSPGRTGPTGQYSNGHVTQMISTTFSTTQATGTIHHSIMPWSSTCRVSQQPNAMVWPRELPSIRLPTARRVLPSFESSSMHPKGTKQTELRPSLQRNRSYWNHMILHDIRITHSFTIRNRLHMIIWYTYIYTLLYWWWWHPPRHVTVKHIAPSLAKMVRVQKTKNNEDPGGQKGSKIHIQSPSANQRMQGVNKEWTRKMWRMSNNDIHSLSKLSKLSRVAGPCDSWQSCRCDGTSNGGTSHRLQGERHPLQPLWTFFFTLSWKFPSVRPAYSQQWA